MLVIWITTCILAYTGVTSAVTCPSSRCICNLDIIDCSNQNFSVVPSFLPVQSSAHYNVLKLSKNSLTHLTANAFRNILVTKIDLSDNKIEIIDRQAFSGLENKLMDLNLKNNKLTETGDFLKTLRNLKTLNLIGNPIDGINGFRDDVFYSLGTNLTELQFGDNTLSRWPTPLRHLQTLFKLYFEGKSMYGIPYTGFHGFENTLRTLSLVKTGLTNVPLALSYLIHLQEFIYDDNPATGDAGVSDQSFKGLPITSLSLRNDGLSTFPVVLHHLHHLSALYLDRNPMWYITDEMIYNVQSRLSIVSLVDCHLDRIPQSVLRISFLENLDLSFNNINSVYTNDLSHNEHLRKLNLANNPLKYIASGSFSELPALEVLNVTNTKLKTIPHAVQNPVHLTRVELEHTPVECTCDLMWILPLVQNRSITFSGECDTVSQSLEQYITNRVPTC